MLNQLQVAVHVGGFQIRPPTGYVLKRKPGPDGSEAFAWVGAPRSDKTQPYLMVATIGLPAAEAKKYTLDQILDKFLQGVERRRAADWKRTPTEHGSINGQAFVRARWNASVRGSALKMHGFHYVATFGHRVIQISSQDAEPYHQRALKVAEAGALTFQIKSQ